MEKRLRSFPARSNQVHLLMNKQAPQKSMCFFSVVAVIGRALPLRFSVDPVSLILFMKLRTAMREHSKLGYFFQILYGFQPFSLKSFSMTDFFLSVKTILLRLSELGDCVTPE